MPKQFKVSDIVQLLEDLAAATNESLDRYGLGQISEKVGGSVSQKYLYDYLFQPVRKAKNHSGHLRLMPNKIDELVKFLGFANFSSYKESIENPVDPVLQHLTGCYYSYIRKNSETGVLLCSPVIIKYEHNKVILKLQGPLWTYTGELRYVNGCLYCLMESAKSGKVFHHVYKIGRRLKPEVLMGIFSGVSSSNDPIGGRCILVRQVNEFDKLENKKIVIDNLLQSADEEDIKLGRYFREYADNNLKINIPFGFDLDDLGGVGFSI